MSEYKYLGLIVVAGRNFSTSHGKQLIKFRSAANTVLNSRCVSSETVLMKLLFTMCVPILTYASEAVSYSVRQTNSMTVALNDCIRRIFGYNRWESVRFLRLEMGYPSITDIFYRRKESFSNNIPLTGNSTLQALLGLSHH